MWKTSAMVSKRKRCRSADPRERNEPFVMALDTNIITAATSQLAAKIKGLDHRLSFTRGQVEMAMHEATTLNITLETEMREGMGQSSGKANERFDREADGLDEACFDQNQMCKHLEAYYKRGCRWESADVNEEEENEDEQIDEEEVEDEQESEEEFHAGYPSSYTSPSDEEEVEEYDPELAPYPLRAVPFSDDEEHDKENRVADDYLDALERSLNSQT
ncbi:hypothetical protein L596_005549 [Steinernema carpocapsae]|uniref:Uncharacterized protein n=1 Tax=Steinernema carpocapsae TaxID=34508 RepID=A0A4U8UZC0_STECR|nr:hypothetical protein L596_005538 [Steinernema carpocapsae]TMS38927.1 hypothetical protein L596_005549 [Steinernema carpocapsae]